MSDLAERQDSQVAQVSDTESIMQVISRAASDPQTDVDKLERMMDLYERMEGKKAESAFNAALVAAQTEMRPVSADATNPQTRSDYATYARLDKALRPIYTKHGFSLSFDTGDGAPDGYVRVICHVSHSGGHSRTHHADMPADGLGAKGNAVMTKTHATGSAMSYGMRYLLKMIFNVAIGEDDDDGNGAGVPRINEEQAAEIRRQIKELGADEKTFCKYMLAHNVEDIRADAYDDALKALEKKREKINAAKK